MVRRPRRLRSFVRYLPALAVAGALFAQAREAKAATYMVTNLNTSGTGSLEAAISAAQAMPATHTIVFNAGLKGDIMVPSGGFSVSNAVSLTIQGPGSGRIVLNGNNANRIFNATSATLKITGLTLANGYSSDANGGAIDASNGTLEIDDCHFENNQAGTGNGGAVYHISSSTETLTISRSSFANNGASNGGAVSAMGGVAISNSTFAVNNAINTGGAIYLSPQTNGVDLRNLTVVQNTAAGPTGSVGGIASLFGFDTVELKNSIVVGNLRAGMAADMQVAGMASPNLFSNGANIVGTVTQGVGEFSPGDLTSDPPSNIVRPYGVLSFNTQAHGAPPVPNGPAIDVGNNTDAALSPKDQLGNPRVVPRTGSTPESDIGAIELSPAMLYVNKSVSGGTSDGSSWPNAVPELRDALAYASEGTELWVAAGVYHPVAQGMISGPADPKRELSFFIGYSLKLLGGFAGGETQASQRNPSANVVVLSGDIDNNDSVQPIVVNASSTTGLDNNSKRIVEIHNSAADVELDGIVITAGAANHGAHVDAAGMGVLCNQLVLNQVTITGNVNQGASVQANTFTFVNLNVQGNSTAGALPGTGMTLLGGGGTITNGTFVGNSGLGPGGGLYVTNMTPLVCNNCGFFGNSSADDGGGLWSQGSNLIFNNSVFSGNAAASGGAFFVAGGGQAMFTYATIAGNSAGANGPAGVLESDSMAMQGTQGSIRNSIVWGNAPVANAQFYTNDISGGSNPLWIVSGSNVQNGLGSWASNGGGNLSGVLPGFVDADGADNQAGTPDDDLRLTPGGPCENTGIPNLMSPMPPALDLDGNPREVPAGQPDMGAYEVQVQPNNPPVVNHASPYHATEGVPFGQVISVTDADGDGLSLQVVKAPIWLTVSTPNNGTPTAHFGLMGTPTIGDVGTHTIEVEVMDGKVAAPILASFDVIVMPAGGVGGMGGGAGAGGMAGSAGAAGSSGMAGNGGMSGMAGNGGTSGMAGAAGDGGMAGAAGEGGMAGEAGSGQGTTLPDPWGEPPASGVGGGSGNAGASGGGGQIESNLPSGVGGNASEPRGEPVESGLPASCSLSASTPPDNRTLWGWAALVAALPLLRRRRRRSSLGAR